MSTVGVNRGKVMLTGGSGLVGAAVMRALLERGYQVRALVRNPERIAAASGVEPVVGDLNDPSAVGRAMVGCWGAIHCAADYRLSLRPREVTAMVQTNVGGTANVLGEAAAAGVRRVVHCSTVGTLAFTRSGRVCREEDVAASAATLSGPYKRSKWAAERLALSGCGEHLDVVVVQPSTPVGSGDWRPTPTGATIRDFLLGRIPAVVDTGLNLVDVEAVGRGHVLALERGSAGRSYILGDINLTLGELLSRVARLAGRPSPRLRVPLAAGYLAAACSEAAARLRGRPAAIPLTAVRMASHPMYVDPSRAIRELGWQPGDLEVALSRAVAELGRPPD